MNQSHSRLFPERDLSTDWVLLPTKSSKRRTATAVAAAATAAAVDVPVGSYFSPCVSAPIIAGEEETADKETEDSW